jgi:hypothetical protein
MVVVAFELLNLCCAVLCFVCVCVCVATDTCRATFCFKNVSSHGAVVILDRYVAELLSLMNAYCGPECRVCCIFSKSFE